MHTVTSADGTTIACWQNGSGGAHLVLVHGTAANHTRWTSIGARFAEYFTVTAIDRRGRGDSGDQAKYAIAREFDDVAAVVNSLDGPVLLFGHSYGGVCALEAAMRIERLRGLILYEPPIVGDGETVYAEGQLARLEALLATGDREAVVTTFMTEVVGAPPSQLDMLMSSPAWPGRVAAAHTILRECRAEDTYRLDTARANQLAIPVLLLLGGDSPGFFRTATARLEEALPNARTVVMPGQQHVAMDTGPDLVTDAVLDFWREIGGVFAR